MSASRREPHLVIGEALVDLIRRPGGVVSGRVGGSPLNVAVGLSRLDVPALLQTHIGTDEYGAMIADHLAENDVALVDGSVAGSRTSTAVATIDDAGAATYEFDIHWSLDRVADHSPALLHTGSIGAVLEPGASVVEETIRVLRDTATVSYDPNVRSRLMGERASARARIESLVHLADVVKASSEDLEYLYPQSDTEVIARRWRDLGPALVVVTHGEVGAYAVGWAAQVRIPAPASRLVDTIGAGDSFMAGLLAAMSDEDLLGRSKSSRLRELDQDTLKRLLQFAASCAAVTVSRVGSDPPRRDELALAAG